MAYKNKAGDMATIRSGYRGRGFEVLLTRALSGNTVIYFKTDSLCTARKAAREALGVRALRPVA